MYINQVVDMLQLTVRTENVLKSQGITTISELLMRSPSDISKLPNASSKVVLEIQTALAVKGLQLNTIGYSAFSADKVESSATQALALEMFRQEIGKLVLQQNLAHYRHPMLNAQSMPNLAESVADATDVFIKVFSRSA